MKKTDYNICPEYNLILEYIGGSVTYEDIIDLKKREVQDKLYKPDYNIIIDFRNFDSQFNSSRKIAMSKLIDFFQKIEMNGKAAVLTSLPNQVVFSEVMKDLVKNSLKIETKSFSTLDAALKFVDCPVESNKKIKNILDELAKV